MATAIKAKAQAFHMATADLYGLALPAINVRIDGLTPLLMNNPAVMGMKIDKDASALEKSEPKLYRDENGSLVISSFGLRSSICTGGANIASPVPRKKMKNYLYEQLFVLPARWLVLTRDGAPITEMDEINEARGVINGGGSIMVYRPQINLPWTIEATLVWYTQDTSDGSQMAMVDALRRCGEIAGVLCGLGDWRPQNKGDYGRFRMTVL